MSAAEIKTLLASFDMEPNKALGQNFLADDDAVRAIAVTAYCDGLPVLEIGPGLGALTRGLLECGANVTAVELDRKMCACLEKLFENDPALTVINCDFLKFDIDSFAARGDFSVAGNLPYYITTPICMKLVTGRVLPRRMTLMLQKEAAARFTAQCRTKLYGPLSVLCRLYYDCRTVMTLSPSSYYPQPEVESAVVMLERKDGVSPVPGLPRALETAFSMRRKTLSNNLRAAGFSREEAEALLARCDIAPSARPEEISPELFRSLAQKHSF